MRELGRQISRDYAGKDVLLIGVLKGAVFFLADLMRQIDVDCEVDFMAVSSYGSSTDSSGVVRILKDLDAPIEGRHVLIVEDIVDSGLTLSYLFRMLRGRSPALARGLRAAHEARRGARWTCRSATWASRSRTLRDRLRARPRRALPEPALRRGAERALTAPGSGAENGELDRYTTATLAFHPHAGSLAVSRFFKSAAFPILIVVVLAFFAQR